MPGPGAKRAKTEVSYGPVRARAGLKLHKDENEPMINRQ